MQEKQAQTLKKFEEMARQREQAMNAARQKAEESYVQEKRKAAVSADRARIELDGLRNELYAIGPKPPGDPAAPSRIDAGTIERQLLGQCATALVGMAQEADRLETVIVGLQGYVRNVCLAPQ